MKVLRSNLILALNLAIAEQSIYEHEELKYKGNSALLTGWKELRMALIRKEKLGVVDK